MRIPRKRTRLGLYMAKPVRPRLATKALPSPAVVLGAFVLFCREQGLFATRLVALDGSKFRAAASAKRIMGERDIAEEAARIDQRIAGYLGDLDATDATETDDADAERTAAARGAQGAAG